MSPPRTPAPTPSDGSTIEPPVPLTSSLDPNFRPIDLNSALRLAGAENPELNIARQRVVESVALRQLAAAQILPTINLGTNYDSHNGNLQQSNGNILSVNRSALYVGAGANAVAAGTVNIPGLVLSGNVGEGVFALLVACQVVRERGFASDAVRNQVFLAVTLACVDSLRLLATARHAYLDAIVDYNRSQFELYVAMGQPPADALARPVPTEGIAAPGSAAAAPVR